LDRVVNLLDEGLDVAIRIGHLRDSALVAVKVGEVRRVVCASPAYLRGKRPLRDPSDLVAHDCISCSQVTPSDVWYFWVPPRAKPRQIKTRARLIVNTTDAAIGAALDARGVTCVLSYQVEAELRQRRLVELLTPFEPEPLPVHVIYSAAAATSAKVRAFVDMTVPKLRAALSGAALPSGPKSRRGSRDESD
jgi:DNA-binding transcriptional LysR family regulator